jgi:hypothetical protein
MIYVLIALIAIVTAALILLRTNTGIVFLAVCAGSVLVAAAGKHTDLLAHSMGSSVQVSSNIVQASIVLLPAIISALLLRKRIPKSRIVLGLIPAFCSAIVGLTLVYPFLSASFQSTLTSGKGWPFLVQYYELIVVIGIISSLITLALTVPKHHSDHHKKGGKH